MYIDSHAHLDAKPFAAERTEVLRRAAEAGLTHVLTIGNGDGPMEMGVAREIAAEIERERVNGAVLPQVLASAGVHPHDAKKVDEAARGLMRQMAASPAILAWGEIGLDYHYHHSGHEEQKTVFVEQLGLAAEFDLPVIIHCRPREGTSDAFDDLFQLLDEHWRTRRGVLHCFTGGRAEAEKAIGRGFMVSFAGNVTFPKAESIRQAAAYVPADCFLVETDCPFLAPVPFRGKRNEPALVSRTAEAIGELRGVSGVEIGRQTSENFLRFFGAYERGKALLGGRDGN